MGDGTSLAAGHESQRRFTREMLRSAHRGGSGARVPERIADWAARGRGAVAGSQPWKPMIKDIEAVERIDASPEEVVRPPLARGTRRSQKRRRL